jgi:hypothetical protein
MRVPSSVALLLVSFSYTLPAEDPLATDPFRPLDNAQKVGTFVRRSVEPTALGKSLFTASIAQWRDSPTEWGQGMDAFGHRYGHRLATRACEEGIGLAGSLLLHQDPRYFRSGQEGIWRRTRHAILHTLRTRTDEGDWTFPGWRMAANYGSQFISNSWRPDRENTVNDALRRGTISVGYDMASNVFKEFWPDIKRKLFRR